MQALRHVAGLERPAADYIPYSHHVTPSIIATRTAEYLSVWRLGGRTFEGRSVHDKIRWIEDLNNTLRSQGSKGVSLWTHVVRRHVSLVEHATPFENPFCRGFDERYRATFDRALTNELYLTVLVQPPSDPTLRLLSRFERKTPESVAAWQTTAIDTLSDINRNLSGALHRYDPELLTTYE